MKWLTVICVTAAALCARGAERMYPVFPAGAGIVVDGKLDEGAWGRAPAGTHFFALDPSRQIGPTEFKLLHSPHGLYLGVTAHEKDTDALVAKKGDGEKVWSGDDSFEIFFGASGGKKWVRFAANCAGTQFNPAAATAATTAPGKGYCVEMFIPFAALGYKAAPERISGNICRNRFAGREGSFHSWGLVDRAYKEKRHWAEFMLLPESALVPVDRLDRFINFCGHTPLLQNAVAREQRFNELLRSAAAVGARDERILSGWSARAEQAKLYLKHHQSIDRALKDAPENPFAAVEPPAVTCPDPRLFLAPVPLGPEEDEFLVKIQLEELLK